MWLRRRRRRRRCHFFLLCPPYGERQEAASLSHILEMLSISPSLRPPKLASGQNGGPLFPPLLHFFSHTLFPFFIHIYSIKGGRRGVAFLPPENPPLSSFPLLCLSRNISLSPPSPPSSSSSSSFPDPIFHSINLMHKTTAAIPPPFRSEDGNNFAPREKMSVSFLTLALAPLFRMGSKKTAEKKKKRQGKKEQCF